jgi:hypothetical protein
VEKLDKFLQFLEKSGVSEILDSVKENNLSKGNNQSAGGRATRLSNKVKKKKQKSKNEEVKKAYKYKKGCKTSS